ncbi:MAG: type III-B CRISPR module RAMP protein Cmr1 [Nitrospirae bacterium]|nr:type III-B CRISPR module RAMP protein Cmr1 [Nitrospirota bacterium]
MMSQPTVIEAEYSIVTPMFLGDAKQEATEIRPPSIKGALRFWWRALNWSRMLAQNGNNVTEALKTLHSEEGRLFGQAGDEDRGGQGCFLMSVTSIGITLRSKEQLNGNDSPAPLGKWRPYLVGLGLASYNKEEKKSKYNRSAITSGKFKVRVRSRPETTLADVKSIEESLLLFGLLGGLGSRTRRGLGSVSITSLSGGKLSAPSGIEEWKAAIQKLTGTPITAPEPPFSAFSSVTRMDMSLKGKNAWNLLEKTASEMMRYRSWGQDRNNTGTHKVNGIELFVDDHAIMLNAIANGTPPTVLPDRIVFGLPHNYFFSSITGAEKMKKAEIAPDSEGRTRRASPLFIHIHKFKDNDFAVIQTLFQSMFLCPSDYVAVKAEKLRPTHRLIPSVDWGHIRCYLDRFADREVVLP